MSRKKPTPRQRLKRLERMIREFNRLTTRAYIECEALDEELGGDWFDLWRREIQDMIELEEALNYWRKLSTTALVKHRAKLQLERAGITNGLD